MDSISLKSLKCNKNSSDYHLFKMLKSDEKRRIVLRKKMNRFINVKFKSSPHHFRILDLWHYAMDLAWWKIFFFFFITFWVIHLFFGTMYFLGGPGGISNISTTETNAFLRWLHCIFFSVQTMSTIGYGQMSPITVYVNFIVAFEIFVGYFFETIFLSLLLGKFARPSSLKRNILFSKNAVVYRNKKGENVLKIRCSNTRHSTPTISPCLKLVCFIWRTDSPYKYKIRKMNFKLHGEMDDPIMPLPFDIKHVIDDTSPIYECLPEMSGEGSEYKGREWKKKNFEIVVFYEGTDSATCDSFQAYSSYIPCDLLLNHKFDNCFYWNDKKKKYIVDYKTFSKTKYISNYEEEEEEIFNL